MTMDDFSTSDFEFEPMGDGVEDSGVTTPPEQPTQPAYDPQKIAALEAQVEANNRRFEDMQRIFGGGQQQQPADQRAYLHNLLINEPEKVIEMATQQAVAQFEQQQTQRQFVESFNSQNPDLKDFGPQVDHEARLLMEQAQAQGKPYTDVSTLYKDAGNSLRQKFVQAVQAQQRTQMATTQALSLTPGNQPMPTNSGEPDFSKMSRADFYAWGAAQQRKHYQY